MGTRQSARRPSRRADLSLSPDTRTRRTAELLPVKLTDDELLAYGCELAREERVLAELQERRKEVTQNIRAEMGEHQARIRKLSRFVESGEEPREVECEELWDYRQGKLVVTRLDTGVVVTERPLTPEERQGDLLPASGAE